MNDRVYFADDDVTLGAMFFSHTKTACSDTDKHSSLASEVHELLLKSPTEAQDGNTLRWTTAVLAWAVLGFLSVSRSTVSRSALLVVDH